MVKRWQGYGKVIVKVPWPFGTNVHRIDLSIKDLGVRWERSLVQLTVELERKIRYINDADKIMTRVDLVVYQKEFPIIPTLIRGQPLKAAATSLYMLVQELDGSAYLEQGIALCFWGWERQPEVAAFPRSKDNIMIIGKQLVAEDSYVHTETFHWPRLEGGADQVEAVLTEEKFIPTREGIHFRGVLKLSALTDEGKTLPLSVLVPGKVPTDTELVGRATLQALKVVDEGKAIIAVKLEWRLIQDKTIPVLLAPEGKGENFFLCRFIQRETRTWRGEINTKLPEKAKLIEEVTVAGVQRRIVTTEKGLLCMGQIALDLYYINGAEQEKCYRVRIPWEDWVTTDDRQENNGSAQEEKEYKIGVITVKGEQNRFRNGDELSLLVEMEYILTEGQRQKVTLPVPAFIGETTTILAEKIIVEEPFEYYVEIPVVRPVDFGESHRLWWRNGVVRGETEDGGVFLKAKPIIIWQYRNTAHQTKVIELRPVFDWFHVAPSIRRGNRAQVRTKPLRLQLQATKEGNFGIQLLLSGRLTVTTEEVRTVDIGRPPEQAEAPFLPAKKSSVLKWEEKLPFCVAQIITAHFFLGQFRQVQTEDLFLLEGEVRGEITYLGKDGVSRYYSLKKELWANLPPAYGNVPLLVPVLTGWNCYPLPEWNWEKGGVWCEITIDLLAFTANQISGKEVSK